MGFYKQDDRILITHQNVRWSKRNTPLSTKNVTPNPTLLYLMLLLFLVLYSKGVIELQYYSGYNSLDKLFILEDIMSETANSVLESKASDQLAKQILAELDQPDPDLAKAKEILSEDSEEHD